MGAAEPTSVELFTTFVKTAGWFGGVFPAPELPQFLALPMLLVMPLAQPSCMLLMAASGEVAALFQDDSLVGEPGHYKALPSKNQASSSIQTALLMIVSLDS